MKTILVTGAGGNAAMNFIESLRISGENYRIIGVDTNASHLECADCDKRYIVPRCSDPTYINSLNKIIVDERVDLLHPQPDIEVAFIARNREAFKAKTFIPETSAIEICHNKMITNEVLGSKKVAVPLSIQLHSDREIETAFQKIKSVSQIIWVRAIFGAGSRAALPIDNVAQARSWISYWNAFKNVPTQDFMFAEFLPGKEYAFQSLWKNGELITSMARERVEYLFGNQMPSGQSSSPSIAKTVHREDVNQTATAAVRAVSAVPEGVFCVDMKENAKGEPCVTEINLGRFYTTSNFFSHAGLNMPHLYTKMALGEPIPGQKPYNGLPENLFWVRGVDRLPKLFNNPSWMAK